MLRMKEEGDFQMIHILFGAASAGTLKFALKKNKDEKVLSFWDIFSIGPIWKLHEKQGEDARFDWMKSVVSDEFGGFPDYKQDFQKTVEQILSIQEGEPITIWVADNAHEQTGLRYVLYLFKNKTNEIKVINATKMHQEQFNRPDIEYMLLHTGEITPEKFRVIYEQSKSMSILQQCERKQLEDEWLGLIDTKETLRIWQHGKITSVREDYYDQLMINLAEKLQLEREREEETEDFMKSARVIGEVLGHLDQYVGGDFLEYRLRKLIEKEVFEVEGHLKVMRYYGVRLKRG